MWLILWRKNRFCKYFYPITGLIKISCLNKSKFSSGYVPLKHGKKTNFLSISVLFSEIVIFMYKKKNSLWIYPKYFKTTERPSLAVCGSLCGEKQFKYPFNCFDQKSWLNKSKISSGFAHFKHGKKNKLSVYFSARFGDSHFYV